MRVRNNGEGVPRARAVAYNACMRYEVPQFIEIEDKIIGPFTWKQFVYLAGGAGAAIIFYFTLPFVLFMLFGIPLAALAGFLAFHKINNRPFSIFLESAVRYLSGARLYLWRRQTQQIIAADEGRQTPHTPPSGTEGLHRLSRKLTLDTDTGDTSSHGNS